MLKKHHINHPADIYAPAWKTFEYLSFGSIITLFDAIKDLEIKNRISEELKDPIYKDIMQVQNHPAFLEDPFIKAIAAYDSNMRYDLCKKQVKKEIPIRLLKKIISFILIHI